MEDDIMSNTSQKKVDEKTLKDVQALVKLDE